MVDQTRYVIVLYLSVDRLQSVFVFFYFLRIFKYFAVCSSLDLCIVSN